jgi:hypothetical protein
MERSTIVAAQPPERGTSAIVAAQDCPTCAAGNGDVVIGVRGPIAPPEMCNGLMVPIVVFDQIYSFDRAALIGAIPMPANDVARARHRADRLDQKIDVGGIARRQEIGFEPLDREDPTEMARQITVRALRQHAVEGLLVGLAGCIRAARRLREFLLRGETRKARLDLTDGINEGGRGAALCGAAAEQFGAAAEETFNRIILMTDNAGATSEHRALNYLAMRYPGIYEKAAAQFANESALSAVDVSASALSGTRELVDVIFSYTNRRHDYTEKCFCRVDVSEEFPFLVTKMSPYYDR